jgi:hypothetical protein
MPLLQTFANASRRGFAPPSNGAAPAYELISTATGTGSSGTITFSSIPSTYKHLQIRFAVIATPSNGPITSLRFNGDTAGNYGWHYVEGAGGAMSSNNSSSTTSIPIGGWAFGTDTTYPYVGVVDIVDYASTSKFKTVKSLNGTVTVNGGNNEVALQSGLWRSTSAVSSLTVFFSQNFTTSSRVSIYGIKG